jgi:hypothetical protein
MNKIISLITFFLLLLAFAGLGASHKASAHRNSPAPIQAAAKKIVKKENTWKTRKCWGYDGFSWFVGHRDSSGGCVANLP